MHIFHIFILLVLVTHSSPTFFPLAPTLRSRASSSAVVIKLNQTTPFFRAFDAYLKRVNRAANSVVFVCAGARVHPNATPADLGTPDLAVFQVTDAATGHVGDAGAKTSAAIQLPLASPKKTAAASASLASASAFAFKSKSESKLDSDSDADADDTASTTALEVARHTRSRKPSPALLAALASSD